MNHRVVNKATSFLWKRCPGKQYNQQASYKRPKNNCNNSMFPVWHLERCTVDLAPGLIFQVPVAHAPDRIAATKHGDSPSLLFIQEYWLPQTTLVVAFSSLLSKTLPNAGKNNIATTPKRADLTE
jgi:hypothetical protein